MTKKKNNFINERIKIKQKELNVKDIAATVKKIVVDHLGVEEDKVTEEASFIDDLGADSLDTVELVMAFEEEFGSEISDTEAEKILTVGTLLNLLRTNQSKIKFSFGE